MRQDPSDERMPTATLPAEGRPDLGLPGADTPAPRPDAHDELPERLGKRIEREPVGIATGESDLLPDVEPPDAQA
jgi:hypothetical protein